MNQGAKHATRSRRSGANAIKLPSQQLMARTPTQTANEPNAGEHR
jgi:hypothetical protein